METTNRSLRGENKEKSADFSNGCGEGKRRREDVSIISSTKNLDLKID
jgi:hypothetical protein